jgi:hypothetical protein
MAPPEILSRDTSRAVEKGSLIALPPRLCLDQRSWSLDHFSWRTESLRRVLVPGMNVEIAWPMLPGNGGANRSDPAHRVIGMVRAGKTAVGIGVA